MSGAKEVELRFASGAVDAEDLEAEIAVTLSELTDPTSEAAQSAIAAGLHPDDLEAAGVRVTQDSKGFGAVVILIAIASPAATHIVEQFWDEVIWPRLKKKLGGDAVGKRQE